MLISKTDEINQKIDKIDLSLNVFDINMNIFDLFTTFLNDLIKSRFITTIHIPTYNFD